MARDYKQEYRTSQSSTKDKKDRASRNKARRKAIKGGRAKKGDGKDVAHKDGNPRNNSKKNTKVGSRSANRADGGRKGNKAGKARGGRKSKK
jgi:hypothetical protein